MVSVELPANSIAFRQLPRKSECRRILMERFRRNSIGDSFFSFGCDASVTDDMLC